MKRTLAIVTLGVAGLTMTVRASAQLRHPSETTEKKTELQPAAQRKARSRGPTYQRPDTWHEFLLKQLNSSNFDYGAWMEERRQVFLDASVRNPYFKYSAGATLSLLLMIMVCAKQWIDHRRTLWITAEMMADLYNHDLYSRDVAEKAIRKYNDHIESCHAIGAARQRTTMQNVDVDSLWKGKVEQVTEERDRYSCERDAARGEMETK